MTCTIPNPCRKVAAFSVISAVFCSTVALANPPAATPPATPAPAQTTPQPVQPAGHGSTPATGSPAVGITAATQPGQGPQMVFDTPSFDFGKQMAGEPIRHDFWFTNRGNAVLEVSAVRPGCGCTVAGDWDRRVEPGKTGKIPVMLRTEKMNGAVQKNISVTTNMPGQPETVLWLKGTIWTPIDVQPAYVNFGAITDTDHPKEQIVKITNKLDDKIDIKNVKSSNPMFRVEVKPVTEGKEYEMKVTVLPPMPTGSQVANITAETGNAKMATLTVNATAYVPARVEVQPQKILIPKPLTMELERAVYVTFNAGADLKVSDVTMSDSKIAPKLVEDAAGKRFRIVVKFPAGYELPGNQPAKITFKTSDKAFPEVTVPVEAVGTQPATPPVAAGQQPIRVPMNQTTPQTINMTRTPTTQPAAAPSGH